MLDRGQIEAILPHRPPFLFVDSISRIVPGERIEGELRVEGHERFLAGEGPSRFFPGTLLVEAMAQVGAILVLFPKENRGRTIYFRSIEGLELRRRIPEGARVRVEGRIQKLRARFGMLEVEAFLEGELAAKGLMTFALG
ncbi:MAG TPA: 3-hydroxyacyl-[acyl-carrier-protein] dehydratase FabZ [Vicinamibacteria bacterium]|jgi:3-hydroxymyristoyl/3-hydroxydecanoyl-(acyl carrier protein) dehydratase